MKFVANANGTKNLVPVNTVAPVAIPDPPQSSGNVVLTEEGTWQNALSIEHQWMVSDTDTVPGTFAEIPGAVDILYAVNDPEHVGKYLLCRVTGINGSFSTVAYSNVLGPVAS
jgi:hypothetical protein